MLEQGSPSGRVDACSRNACNHPSTLQPDASSFARGHRLCLKKESSGETGGGGGERVGRQTFSTRHVVRMSRSEDVTNPRAWHELQAAATHPHSKGDLQILTAPDLSKQRDASLECFNHSDTLTSMSSSKETKKQ